MSHPQYLAFPVPAGRKTRLPVRAVCVCALQLFCLVNSAMAQETEKQMKWAIAIHGGAGPSPAIFTDEANKARHQSMQDALDVGKGILEKGGSSLDAVEAVVRFLEEDPQFNAGKGAVFNAEGKHELDASIMDGRNRACGAIAGVSRVRNPITLARTVMTQTKHVLLTGAGAEQIAEAHGLELVDNTWFDTPATRARWEEFLRGQDEKDEEKNDKAALLLDTGSYYGTVGCVALDSDGNLAAGTSTGGMTNKRFGRVGDSPIIGAGTWADNETCAVSCTGIGEEYIRNAVAFDVAAKIRYQGISLEESVRHILEKTLKPGDGGIIAVDRFGKVYMGYNSRGMARAAADSSGWQEVRWVEK